MSKSLRIRLHSPDPQEKEVALDELILNPDLAYMGDLEVLLKDNQNHIRLKAIEALAGLENIASLDALQNALFDTDQNVIQQAEIGILRLGEAALDSFIPWLEHPDWPHRQAALNLLSHSQNTQLSEAVLPLIKDSIWEIRASAYPLVARTAHYFHELKIALSLEQHPQAREALLLSMGEINSPESIQFLLNLFLDPMCSEAIQVLASALNHAGERIHKDLLESGIWSPNPEVRASSAALLAQTAYPLLENELIPLLNDKHLYVRQTAAYAIYQVHPEQGFWEFLAGLYNENENIFLMALEELIQFPDPRTGPQLLIALNEYLETDRCIPIIKALGEMNDLGAAPALVELLDILPSLESQLALIEALGSLKAWRAYGPLLKRLSHPERSMREAVTQALISISPEETLWPEILSLETNHSPKALECISFLATHTETRNYLAFLVTELGDGEIVAAIIQKLNEIRVPFLGALIDNWIRLHGNAEDRAAAPVLKAISTLELTPVRIELLKQWLCSRTESIRKEAAHLLLPIATEIRADLEAFLQHEVWFVRQAALLALQNILDKEMLQALKTCLKDKDRDVRITAIQHMGRMNSEVSQTPLLDALENGYREIRAAAARSLGLLPEAPDILEALENSLIEDEAAEVRIAAAEGLVRKKHPDALELVEDALKHEDDDEALAYFFLIIESLDKTRLKKYLPAALNPEHELYCTQALQYLLTEPIELLPYERDLQNCLESQHSFIRNAALKLLLKLQPDKATDWLDATDVEFQIAALETLTLQAKDRGILLQLSQSESAELRQMTYQKILSCPDLHDLYLEFLLHETQESLQQMLLELLSQCHVEIALNGFRWVVLDTNNLSAKIKKTTIWALTQFFNEGGQDILKDCLQQQNLELREETFNTLSLMGLEALPLLTELAENWDSTLRLQSIRTLGQLGSDTLPFLTELWESAEMAIQIAILESIKKIKSAAALPLIQKAVHSKQENVRIHAMECLNLLEDLAFPLLIELVKDSDERLRYDASWILAQLEQEKSYWYHIQGINSQLASRRAQALLALHQEDDTDWQKYSQHLLFDPDYFIRQLYCETQFQDTSYGLKILLRGIRAEVQPVKIAALLSLIRDFPADAYQNEIMMLWDSSPIIFKEALLRAYAELKMPGQALLGLDDDSLLLRYTALCMIGHFQLASAEARIKDIFYHDVHWKLRSIAVWALGRLKTLTLEDFERGLSDPHRSVKIQSVLSLGEHPLPGATESLIALLSEVEYQDIELVENCLRALSYSHHEKALPQLMEILKNHSDDQVKKKILFCIQAMNTEKSLEYLQDLVNYEEELLADLASSLVTEL